MALTSCFVASTCCDCVTNAATLACCFVTNTCCDCVTNTVTLACCFVTNTCWGCVTNAVTLTRCFVANTCCQFLKESVPPHPHQVFKAYDLACTLPSNMGDPCISTHTHNYLGALSYSISKIIFSICIFVLGFQGAVPHQ